VVLATVLVDQLDPSAGECLEGGDLGRVDRVVDDAGDHRS
jgi:hypothetical protein